MSRYRLDEGGFGSLVVLAVSMLIVFALIAMYLREFTPTGPKGGPAGTLESVKKQAQAFEQHQRSHFEDLRREAAQP